MKNTYTVIIKDTESGEVLFEKQADVVIAGACLEDGAEVVFLPSEDEEAVAALIGACEDAFASIMGDDDEDEEF